MQDLTAVGRGIDAARSAKHRLWVARRGVHGGLVDARDWAWRAMDQARPYSYRDGDFPDSFIANSPKVLERDAEPVGQNVFAVWSGDNPLTPNRAEALEEIRARLDGSVSFELITPSTLADWVVDGHPIHSAYQHLSLNHRSDYLRAYLMHHYGGAYLDIKRGYGDIAAAMRRLDQTPDAWVCGYRELKADYVADLRGSTIHSALRRHHGSILGNGAFAARPRTPLTAEWLEEVNRRMDGWAADLARSPGDMWGKNKGYPAPWGGVQAAVFQPLLLKYSDRLLVDNRFKPLLTDFR